MSARRWRRLVKLGPGLVERRYEKRKIGCSQAQATVRDAARQAGFATGGSLLVEREWLNGKGLNGHW